MVLNIYVFWYVLIRNKDIFNLLWNCWMNVEYWNVMRRVIVILIVGIKVGGFFYEKCFV